MLRRSASSRLSVRIVTCRTLLAVGLGLLCSLPAGTATRIEAADPAHYLSDGAPAVRPVSTGNLCRRGAPCGKCPRCYPAQQSPSDLSDSMPGAPSVPPDEGSTPDATGDRIADDVLSEPDEAPRVISDPTRVSTSMASMPNMRGDFCVSGGQFVIQPPPVISDRPIYDHYYGLQSDIPNNRFVTPDGNYDFFVPGGILPGIPPEVIDSWDIEGPYPTGQGTAAAPGEGTAYLIGINPDNGNFVADAEVVTGFEQMEMIQDPILVDLPSMGCSRRMKVSENNNPFPTCRVFFNYDYFHNASLSSGVPSQRRDLGVDRYVLGVERTILQGLGSVEVRLPLVRDLDPTQITTGNGDVESNEFGNLSLTLKFILSTNGSSILTGGMGMNFPTGPDGRVRAFDPYRNSVSRVMQYDNKSVHLAPFLAYGTTSRDRRFYAQAWGQLDIDPNGSPVRTNYNGVRGEGRVQDQTLLFLDGAIGYTILERYCTSGPAQLRRITPALELHYTGSVQDADIYNSGNVVLGNPANQFDVLNMTFASHFQFGERLVVTPAFVTPLTQWDNRFFDGEFGIQMNWYQ